MSAPTFAVLSLFVVSTIIYLRTPRPRAPLPSEDTYIDITTDSVVKFGSLNDKATVDLTVIVPSYNEQSRLPSMLKEAIAHLNSKKSTYEIIVVDDASSDKTAQVAMETAKPLLTSKGTLKVMRLIVNRGKGGSVARGMLAASGKHILFADADGATKFSDVENLLAKMDKFDVAVGSRAHMVSTESVVKRSALRNALSKFLLMSSVYFSWFSLSFWSSWNC